MESRAFHAQAARTVLCETSLRPVDYALISGSALLLGGIAIF
jgi:energy-coupling factor transporter transmembrane protein EcfT